MRTGGGKALVKSLLEAPSGFEPLNRSVANCALKHLGTAPVRLPFLTEEGLRLKEAILPRKVPILITCANSNR